MHMSILSKYLFHAECSSKNTKMKTSKLRSVSRVLIYLSSSIFILFSISISQARTFTNHLDKLQFSIKPELLVEQIYDDNLILSESNPISSWGLSVSPSLKLKLQKEINSVSIFYQAQKGNYFESRKDDFLDHKVQGDLKLQTSRRSDIRLFATYQRKHENRGTGYSQGIGETLLKVDKIREYHSGAIINYGSQDSTGRIEFKINAIAMRLDDRPEAGIFANHNSYNGSFTFYYQLKSNTSMLLEAYRAKHVYKSLSNENTLDNLENRFYLGTNWNATALTRGTLKLGLLQKEFTNKGKETSSGLTWDIGIKWNPLQYTQLDLSTQSQTEESSGTGDFVETISVSSELTHQWTHLLLTSLNAGAIKDSYQPTNQKQGTWHISVRVNYHLRRWLQLGASVTHQERLSTKSGQDFQRNIYKLSLLLNT